MNHKSYRQIEMQPCFECGQDKLHYMKPNTSNMILDYVPESVLTVTKLDNKSTTRWLTYINWF